MHTSTDCLKGKPNFSEQRNLPLQDGPWKYQPWWNNQVYFPPPWTAPVNTYWGEIDNTLVLPLRKLGISVVSGYFIGWLFLGGEISKSAIIEVKNENEYPDDKRY